MGELPLPLAGEGRSRFRNSEPVAPQPASSINAVPQLMRSLKSATPSKPELKGIMLFSHAKPSPRQANRVTNNDLNAVFFYAPALTILESPPCEASFCGPFWPLV
jgi:hypothetical protein